MAQINSYLHFNGNAEEAFTFYKSVFGGEFKALTRFKEMESPEMPISDHEAHKVFHISLPIGQNTLMGSDVPEILGQVNENENRFKLVLNPESREEADRLFDGLTVGGAVEMPMGDSPWGAYFGMFRDKFGIEWMVNYEQR